MIFFRNQSQFSNVTENKPWTLSLWKAFHDSKQQLHFFNKQSVYKQLLSVYLKWNLQATGSFIRKNGLLILTTKNKEKNRTLGQGRSLFDKTFHNENKEKHFYQTTHFHNSISNFWGWGLIKKCNSCLCRKARFTQRIVVWTTHFD